MRGALDRFPLFRSEVYPPVMEKADAIAKGLVAGMRFLAATLSFHVFEGLHDLNSLFDCHPPVGIALTWIARRRWRRRRII